MKQAVKTIVEALEKEINHIMDNYDAYRNEINKDFEYGSFIFEMNINEISEYGGEWDEILNSVNIEIEIKHVDVTNEKSFLLTNLSNEIFNQLEENYTNY